MTLPISNTSYGIISDAMFDAGKLQEGQEPNSQQLSDNLRRLNDIVNLWQTQGLKLFLQEDVIVPLVVGQTQYVLGPSGPAVVMLRPPRILSGFILQLPSEVRRPLVMISRDEWERLSQVTGNNGTINSFFVDKQTTNTILNVWPPPDSTEAQNTASFLMQTYVPGPTSLTASSAFPQEWRIALRWGLADDISTGQPQTIMQNCKMNAKVYREALEDWDVEDAPTMFNVDSRFYDHMGRFR